MKKIFLTLLFLFLTSISTNAFAICSGNAVGCSGKSTTALCTVLLSGNQMCTSSGTSGEADFICAPTVNGCSELTDAECATIEARNAGCAIFATGDANANAFVTTMCNALSIVQGNGGKAFAAFAIISVGIGFFTGKVSWGLMIGVTAGIAAMFGATSIVAAITGESVINCGNAEILSN
jgi:type IV secretory pathway VirB2 component (pilin)